MISRAELKRRSDPDLFPQVAVPFLDVHTEPGVKGTILATLPRCAVVEALSEPESSGWRRIQTADGTQGWVPGQALKPRAFSEAFLLGSSDDPASYFPSAAAGMLSGAQEETLRSAIVSSALSWRGTSYRWGGKSARGIDCSGLAFISYLENGLLIYRDANILPGFPIREISRENMQPGDLIFFPGHVAVYIGDDRYVHSTGFRLTPWVTVNSLRPSDPLYRQDLAEKITAIGSLFNQKR